MKSPSVHGELVGGSPGELYVCGEDSALAVNEGCARETREVDADASRHPMRARCLDILSK